MVVATLAPVVPAPVALQCEWDDALIPTGRHPMAGRWLCSWKCWSEMRQAFGEPVEAPSFTYRFQVCLKETWRPGGRISSKLRLPVLKYAEMQEVQAAVAVANQWVYGLSRPAKAVVVDALSGEEVYSVE